MTTRHHAPLRVHVSETCIDDDLIYYYRDERLTGTRYRTYPDGTLSYEEEFVNGYPEGYERCWYRNGQLRLEVPKHLGCFEDGVYREWYESGQLKLLRRRKDNVLLESADLDESGQITNHWLAPDEKSQISD